MLSGRVEVVVCDVAKVDTYALAAYFGSSFKTGAKQ